MAFASSASADVVRISEGFEGGIPTGWVVSPAISGTAPVNWGKPIDASEFSAQSGTATSYLFNSYNSTPTSANKIDDYLMTPTFSFNNGTTVSFFVRADADQSFPDRMRVLLSTSGASTATSAFTFVLGDINPSYASSGTGAFPTAGWTQYTYTIGGLASGFNFVSGRLAFEYLINDTTSQGNYIGLDTVRVAVTVPEPDSLALAAIGLVAIGVGARRARRSAARA